MLALLAVGLAGCAKPDWIESTLVTVDVTGQWKGRVADLPTEMTLRQRGSLVTGEATVLGHQYAKGGAVTGDVSGDVLRLRQTDGRWRFELTVADDEMTGSANAGAGVASVRLRRSQ